jgi:predicted O-methyltransferase YrrM
VESLPNVLLQIFEKKQVFDPEGRSHPLDSNITESEALSLYRAIRSIRPGHCVEIGLAHGVSTLAILGAIAANQSGHHFVIDPFQRNYDYCGEAMIERAGFASLHTFFERFPEEVIPQLPKLQFGFIDSSHLFDLTIMEFVLIDKKLVPGGIIALHDLWMPAMQSVVRFILANRAYRICREFSEEAPRRSVRERCKESVGRWLSKIPVAKRVFSVNLLCTWSTFRTQNLLFLRKVSDDQRDWRFHQPF